MKLKINFKGNYSILLLDIITFPIEAKKMPFRYNVTFQLIKAHDVNISVRFCYTNVRFCKAKRGSFASKSFIGFAVAERIALKLTVIQASERRRYPGPDQEKLGGFYSVLNDLTGFSTAAFSACRLITSNAIPSEIIPATANTHQAISMR